MTLKLVGWFNTRVCPRCKGRGKVRCPRVFNEKGKEAPGGGHPIPCPECKGKKVVAVTGGGA